jgi:hypothetical protein
MFLKEPVGLGGHDEVVSVQVPDFVRPPGNGHASPLGYESGVMSFGLGEISDTVGKGQGLDKIREAKNAFELSDPSLLDELPFRHLRVEFTDLLVGYMRGISTARYTPLLCKFCHFSSGLLESISSKR